ncbi:FKBP-type peptidyl-prolyl cis-trans isomerase [Hymenobacter daecheongensis]|uniref:FKBP-type peptidyl-prolyl cis-trans isomerase n=1 Tax=Hymenobacter daecheongensis TaxID=496053 RepID=UPI000A49D873|nr:FKBP-type peptidyl-prolyl cis-trans isomerase [Hymenobacter daecheongensis]
MSRFCSFAALVCLLLAAASAAHAGHRAMPTDTVRLASGVRYVVRMPGSGAPARPGDRMAVHYTGFLPDGRMFDSSAGQGRPLRLRVGRGEVIRGWDEVLLLLPAGTRAWVSIPAEQAYGSRGVRNPDDESRFLIPPNANLVFELEVVRIR